MSRKGFFFLLIGLAAAVFLTICILIIVLVTAPRGQKKQTHIKEPALETEETIEEEVIIDEEPETSAGISFSIPQVSPNATLAVGDGLASIRGRVHTGEINPINFENPDINVLKQMGTGQFLISYFTGEEYFKAGDYDKAISEYNIAIRDSSSFAEAYISRGNAYLRKKFYMRAIEDYSTAIRLENNRAELYNYRGFARMELAIQGSSGFAAAIEDFSRAIAINPNYVDALINRSLAFYQSGDYDRTIEDCNKIIRLEPNNASIWNRRGSAYYQKKDDDRAISDFTEAIRINPNYVMAWRNRGFAWHSKGEAEKALEDFMTAEQLR